MKTYSTAGGYITEKNFSDHVSSISFGRYFDEAGILQVNGTGIQLLRDNQLIKQIPAEDITYLEIVKEKNSKLFYILMVILNFVGLFTIQDKSINPVRLLFLITIFNIVMVVIYSRFYWLKVVFTNEEKQQQILYISPSWKITLPGGGRNLNPISSILEWQDLKHMKKVLESGKKMTVSPD